MNIGQVWNYFEQNAGIRRAPWPKGRYITISQFGIILTLKNGKHKYLPWLRAADLVAQDWEIYGG